MAAKNSPNVTLETKNIVNGELEPWTVSFLCSYSVPMDNHYKLLEVCCLFLFIALARESNLSSLKKRGLYAHLLKTVEGGGRGPTYLGEEVTKSPSKIEKPRNPGYKVPLSQLKALRKKDDIVSAGQYERDSFVPAKTKGINFDLFILKCAILQLAA